MDEVTMIAEVRGIRDGWRRAGLEVALVPTMGYLHEGHLRLVDEAKRRADRVIASIFVNPLQFRPGEDLDRYPRDLPRDRALLESRGADLLFAPATREMYPAPAMVRVDPGALGTVYEGAVRPGHFAGVLTVVGKLFNQTGPDVAVFGQKDIQQVTLVTRMVRELDWPIEIVVVPTVREPDGLALSSRNVYLGPEDRRDAVGLSEALGAARSAWQAGGRRPAELETAMRERLAGRPRLAVDYIAIVGGESGEPLDEVDERTIVAVAARVGPTRLIDNITLGRGL
ncbi:MAG: pantoate--beta-alanine ligase, partial [Gemmatimonadota bacterium]